MHEPMNDACMGMRNANSMGGTIPPSQQPLPSVNHVMGPPQFRTSSTYPSPHSSGPATPLQSSSLAPSPTPVGQSQRLSQGLATSPGSGQGGRMGQGLATSPGSGQGGRMGQGSGMVSSSPSPGQRMMTIQNTSPVTNVTNVTNVANVTNVTNSQGGGNNGGGGVVQQQQQQMVQVQQQQVQPPPYTRQAQGAGGGGGLSTPMQSGAQPTQFHVSSSTTPHSTATPLENGKPTCSNYQQSSTTLGQNQQQQQPTPKEQYRTLKKRFKFLVYENECYQEELRNLQRKLLKLSRDKNFLLDRLIQYEKLSDSSDDSDSNSVKTVEDKPKPPKKNELRKSRPSASRRRPTVSRPKVGGATPGVNKPDMSMTSPMMETGGMDGMKTEYDPSMRTDQMGMPSSNGCQNTSVNNFEGTTSNQGGQMNTELQSHQSALPPIEGVVKMEH